MWRLYKVFAILIFFTLSSRLLGQARIELIDSSKADCSFRGLSVVTDKVVWVSGSRGTVGRSVDGGKTWIWVKVAGFEKSDFRDIEAFDKNRAVIMASGTPAVILKTVDGGKTWKLVFKDERPEMFLDAMDFWDKKHGMMVGDPINGHFVLLETKDGGNSWKLWDTAFCPAARDSEAVFAASGTSIVCWNKSLVGFVTGGSNCRFVFCNILSQTWLYGTQQWMTESKPSQGAFSVAISKRHMIIVGGDYANDTAGKWAFHYIDNQSYDRFAQAPSGYRSAVEFINNSGREFGECVITTGTRGVDICKHISCVSHDCWECSKISTSGFHTVRKANKGKAVFLAGSKGRIGKLSY